MRIILYTPRELKALGIHNDPEYFYGISRDTYKNIANCSRKNNEGLEVLAEDDHCYKIKVWYIPKEFVKEVKYEENKECLK